MTFSDWLSERARDGALLPAQIVLQRYQELAVDEGPEYMSTVEAARILGYSPKRWRVWCEEGAIGGAWQDSENGRWRLPAPACRAHLLKLQNQKRSRRKGSRRGPNKKAQAAYPALVRPKGIQAG